MATCYASPKVLECAHSRIFRNDGRRSQVKSYTFPAETVQRARNSADLRGTVANHFDIVPVGIEDECTVIVLMVMRPQTGLAVVTTSSSQTCCMEAIDRSSIVNYESYVDAGDCSGFETDPEERLFVDSVPSERFAFCIEPFNTNRFQGYIVECF
jgi:hypothetical protein